MNQRNHHENYNDSRLYYLTIRNKVFDLLGNKCAQCDWDDPRALQVDHKVSYKDDKTQLRGYKLYRALLDNRVDRNDYQLLCANHNWIKRIEKQENRSLDVVSIKPDPEKIKKLIGAGRFKDLVESALRHKEIK